MNQGRVAYNPNSAAILARMYDMQGNSIVGAQDGAMLGMW